MFLQQIVKKKERRDIKEATTANGRKQIRQKEIREKRMDEERRDRGKKSLWVKLCGEKKSDRVTKQ